MLYECCLATPCKFPSVLGLVQGSERSEEVARSKNPETGGRAIPLVDAAVKFFKEFIVEEPPSTQEQPQPATGGISRADDEKKDDKVIDSFEPMYLYDAMKEKRQLMPLLVHSRAHIAASCY